MKYSIHSNEASGNIFLLPDIKHWAGSLYMYGVSSYDYYRYRGNVDSRFRVIGRPSMVGRRESPIARVFHVAQLVAGLSLAISVAPPEDEFYFHKRKRTDIGSPVPFIGTVGWMSSSELSDWFSRKETWNQNIGDCEFAIFPCPSAGVTIVAGSDGSARRFNTEWSGRVINESLVVNQGILRALRLVREAFWRVDS